MMLVLDAGFLILETTGNCLPAVAMAKAGQLVTDNGQPANPWYLQPETNN
ncbi:MAG: hypothetical protein WAU36_12095 [Cyclobacteriaceae bacterium]